MENYLSQINLLSTIVLLLPAILLIFLFLHFKKKKRNNELQESSKFGRRGKKDHIWQILKEYNKKTNKGGSEIKESFVFERPNPENLHDALVRSFIFVDKREAKEKGIRYRRIKYPKRFEKIENYFEELEEETKSFHKKIYETSHKIENIRSQSRKKVKPRKRYVILYKLQQKDVVSDWLAIEVELIKQLNKQGELKDSVVVNKELEPEMEMTWIAPLLNEKIQERKKNQQSELKRIKYQHRKKYWIAKFKGFISKKKVK